jgi:hypothetical protein
MIEDAPVFMMCTLQLVELHMVNNTLAIRETCGKKIWEE